MTEKKKAPSIFTILSAHKASNTLLVMPIISIILYISIHIFGLAPNPKELYLAGELGSYVLQTLPYLIVLTMCFIICLPIMLYRIVRIKLLFHKGVEAPGSIINTVFFKNRGKIDFKYTHAGENHYKSLAVKKCSKTLAIKKDQMITAVVSKKDPKNAIIKEIF